MNQNQNGNVDPVYRHLLVPYLIRPWVEAIIQISYGLMVSLTQSFNGTKYLTPPLSIQLLQIMYEEAEGIVKVK